ncbi:MAG: hypothetical protein K0S51_1999 [Bacillales bacterium]|nr:hypothetical protein [Bacillales bacterium]
MNLSFKKRINKLRNLSLLSIVIGFLLIYLGIFFTSSMLILSFLTGIGFLLIIGSTISFFILGIYEGKALTVKCPHCRKPTKMYKKIDYCMHCNEHITTVPEYHGKEI